MKNFFQRAKKQLIFVGVLLVILAIVLLAVVFLKPEEVTSKLSVNLEKSTIKSGETTFLVLTAYNSGSSELKGKFWVESEELTYVNVSYPNDALLNFVLMPGESITRKMNVSATTNAVRTDYELVAKLISADNSSSTLASKKVLLTVRKE
ncbi:hypothetical protein COV13_03365 [Candidatus Woesearchaeota archaeon CG10_big_fil_rev_8_21_14_0_10_32_9]|nr:MAG: hypothetical protein COV13_03365 [Candidatus Woesearchaeota archaeon CG10_big_fil_rev_8_21_14_0_10_32_9]